MSNRSRLPDNRLMKEFVQAELTRGIRDHHGIAIAKKRQIVQCSPELHDYVFKFGRYYEPAPLPSNFPLMKPNNCFANATHLAVMKRLQYVEGFAFALAGWHLVHHAWCLDAKGRVIDPTWQLGMGYYGVPFDSAFACRWVGRTPNAMGYTAAMWAEMGDTLPSAPMVEPERPVSLERAAKAGWRMDPAEVGVLPTGRGRCVAFGYEAELFKPIKSAVLKARMEVTGELRRTPPHIGWGIEVSAARPADFKKLDKIVWDAWWAANKPKRKGVHPTLNLVRAMAYKTIGENWPRKRRQVPEVPTENKQKTG